MTASQRRATCLKRGTLVSKAARVKRGFNSKEATIGVVYWVLQSKENMQKKDVSFIPVALVERPVAVGCLEKRKPMPHTE